jgi:1,4-dihydroxy-2-naphthoate octaprenyltransferase
LFLLLNCNGLLSHQIIDYEEDLGNTKGTVIKIGRKISFAFLILIQIIFFFLFAIIFRHLLVNIWIYSLFVFLLFWIPLDCVRRAIKASNQLTVRTPKRKEIKDFLQRKLRLIFKYF